MTRTFVKTDSVIVIYDDEILIFAQDYNKETDNVIRKEIDSSNDLKVVISVLDIGHLRMFTSFASFTMWLIEESCIVENCRIVNFG